MSLPVSGNNNQKQGGETPKQQLRTIEVIFGASALVSILVGGIAIARALPQNLPPQPTTTPTIQQVINALNTGGSASLAAGTYPLPSNFAGITMTRAAQSFTMDPNAVLVLPNGYNLPVVEINDSFESQVRSQVTGGKFIEAPDANGNTQGLWTGIRVHSSNSNGTFGISTAYTWFEHPNIGIEYVSDSPTSFVNSNIHIGHWSWHPVTANIQFTNAGNSYAGNHFINCNSELGIDAGTNAVGVKGVTGTGNTFDNCWQYDPTVNQLQSVITTTAIDTNITGHGMTDQWANLGQNTHYTP